jgi:hypothetical protein
VHLISSMILVTNRQLLQFPGHMICSSRVHIPDCIHTI